MGELTRRQQALARVDRSVQRQLAHHVASMELYAEVAKDAMDELSELHGYAVYRTTATVATAHLLAHAAAIEAGTPAAAALAAMQHQYLLKMGQLADAAGANIITTAEVVEPEPLQQQTLLEKLLGS